MDYKEALALIKEYWPGYSAITGGSNNTTKKKKKEEEEEKVGGGGRSFDDDIAPIKEKEEKIDLFQKGALGNIDLGKRFEDGWQLGDGIKTAGETALNVGKAILGTYGDAGLNVVKGFASVPEGIADAVGYAAAGYHDWRGHDLYAEILRQEAAKNSIEEMTKGADEFLNKYSVLGRTTDSALQGLGQVGVIAATGGAGAAAGLGSAGVTALTTGLMGLSGFGSGTSEAYQGGADDLQALKHGLNTGATDAVTELIFGGLGKAVKAVGFSKGLSSADDMLAKLVGSKFKNQTAKNIIEYGIKAGAEGLEEVLAGIAQAYSKYHNYLKDQGVEFEDVLRDENLLEQFLVGFGTSGAMQSGFIPGTREGSLIDSIKQGKDFITGYTQNEQSVINKEVEKKVSEKEKNGTKLTAKEKDAIYRQAERSLEKGFISIDTILEAIGGKDYDNYKQAADFEDSIQKQYDALSKEYEELYNRKGGDKSSKDSDREAFLKGKLPELKKQLDNVKATSSKGQLGKTLFDNVFEKAKSDRVIESYLELARKKQDFEVDMSQYKNENAKKTLQNIIDSGLANNSNEFHDFVDLLTNISTHRGTVFRITDNDGLKGTEHYKEGFYTDGFISNDDGSITINLDSPKALNFIVGHEVTHSLEKSNFYKDLQKAAFKYATEKGELSKYIESVDSRYKSLDRTGKDKEVTSDLIGRYLFTDYEFISNLSANHRNVFQKVFDEIKHLCNLATAGSKAARDLERVKHQFEKAFRDAKAKTDANYSLTPVEAVKPSSSAWMSGANTDEVRTAHPTLYAVDEDATETRNPTQVKNTVSSYRKVYSYLQKEGFNGKILDASSGLGLGTEAGIKEFGFNVEDIEPYPDKDYSPKYTDYSALDEKYDAIISNAVLNVIPQDQRDALVSKMGQMLNPGGKMFINVRGRDVLNSSGKIAINEANMEYFIPRTAKTGSYQKGFTTAELKAYLEDALGDEFEVTDGRKVFGSSSPSAIVTRKGDVKVLDGGSVTRYSLSTWTPEMQKKVSENLVSAGFEKKDVDKWIADTNSIAAKIAEDKARLDFEAHENHTMVKDNLDYYKTVEASTLCAKRLEYQGTFDAIQHRLPNTTITSDMLIELREMMKKHGREVPCGACYVESRRRHLGKFATSWLENYKGDFIPTLADVTTSDGLEALRHSHPDTYNDFVSAMKKKGVANPKVVELRTEYKGEIMKITKATYEKIMKIGGLRLQSFSDFETPHLLDMMQVVHDMASRKFVSQAYTKVPNFAWVLGDTNIKINLSLIPSGTGIDANGNLTFDPKEGMDINDAMRLRDRYSKNVGTTIIGINDAHILKCMADDRIDYIIPFHRSGWGAKELAAMGLESYDDYQDFQKERDIETGKGVPNIDEMSYWDFTKTGKENAEAYLALCAEKGVIPKFEQFLVDNGDGSYSLQPDGSTDGYWKTLINFKMYDNDGVGSPHQAVVPNFNMDEAYRVLAEYEGGANSLPVAKDVLEEFVAKYENDTQYSLSEDNWSKIQEMQMEVNRLNDSIRSLEASAEYKDQMRKVEESIASSNTAEAIESWNRWYEESGLEELNVKRKSLVEELDKLRKEVEETRANEALEEERVAIEKSGLSEADYFRKKAIKEFGYTPYFYDAGYIVSNGKMLNFSGEKGQHFGSRGQDHRAIGTIYAETSGTDALNRFVNDGNIRIVPESPGFDVSATIEPTKEQYATIRKFIYEYANKGYFSVDISDKDGRVVGSLDYQNRINPTRIIADLKHYYATGEVRQPSPFERFSYSLTEADTSYEEVPYQTVLDNLNEYSREDLVSIADQVTDGTFTIAHSMSKDSLVNVLRKTISIVGKDDPTLAFKLPVSKVDQSGDVPVDVLLEDDDAPFPWETDTQKEVVPNYRPSNEEIKSAFEGDLKWMHEAGMESHTTLEEYVGEYGVDGLVEKMILDHFYEPSDSPVDKMIDSIDAELRDSLGEDYDWDGNEALFERVRGIVEEILVDAKSSKSDNEGNQLTIAQAEFFKDSKIRDREGNLRMVYHTTQNDFTVFDHARKGEATDGPNTFLGFFFAESPDHMTQFPEFQNGKTDSYYLDMKKPMDLTDLSKEAFMDIVELTGGDRNEAAEVYDRELEAEKSRARLRGDNNTSLSISQLLYNMVGDYYHADFFDALKPNYDKLIAKGYDGVIDYLDEMMGEREFVVFDSNQAKLTSNTNPTADPDIRYSQSNGYDEYGSYNVYGKDVKLQRDDDLPIAETAQPVENATELPKTQLDEEDEIPIKTVKERLTAKRSNSQTELDNNRRLREEASKSYDDKIAKLRAVYDSKKNKDTKVANNLLRRIERLQRLKADVDAQYAKRISDVESRITKTDVELQKDHTEQDQYERTISRINRMLELEKADLDAEFAQRRDLLKDKDSYISTKASELYKEIRNLKKGVKASEQLGYLLDHGYDWSSIRSALVNIKHTPGETVNINSEAESVAREMLNDDFEQAHFNLDSEYQQRLSELESEAETKRQAAKVANQRMAKHQEYAEQMESLIGDTSTWVDKKMGISYKVNTLRRNLRDIVRDAEGNLDIDRADAIYDELQGKYNHNEAMLHREASRIKSPYAELKITNAEDAYIQMLGELRHNPDTTLTEDIVNEFYEKHKSKIDTDKVNKVIEDARVTYDTLLERVNATLREQGMKEIPYRQGYFPHFTEPKQGWLAKLLNWKTKDFDIPTDIAGLTENFNPNRSWQAFNKQRKSDITDYSFMKGMDTYVQGALDWIYHIEDIQKRRAFENHIRYVHSEKGVQERIDAIRKNTEYDAEEMQEQIDLIYKEAGNPLNNFVTDFRAGTNTLANKKSSLDRGMEELVNRKVYSTMTNLSNRVTGNMVVGSFSSALTNFIPITQSWMEVSPVSSLRAMVDTIKSTIRDDGVVDKSDFLTNRLKQSEALYKTNWDKVSDKATLLMEAVDSFTSQTVWRSKYLENISKGMSESEAIKNADQFAENVIAGRSRGNMPTIFDSKNPLIKTLTAFQLEVNNQYQYFFKDAPQEMKDESVGKLVKGYATAFLGAYAYNALYSSLVGRDAAFDPIGIITDLLKDIFGDDDDEEPAEILLGLTDSILEEVPFVGGLLGGGRVPISSALPYDGLYEAFKGTVEDVSEGDWKGLTKEWMNPLWYLAMPLGGGQIRKTVQGLSMFDDDLPISGSYTDSGKLRFPVEDTFGNRLQAGLFGQYASKNARDYFDNNRSALGEKQIQEFIDVDIPIRDYWEYREGLSGLSKLEEKADYIDSLDLPIDKKNLLINNIADREEPIDMTDYGDYGSFDEFEFANEYPEKYADAQEFGDFNEYYSHYKELGKRSTMEEKVKYLRSQNMSDDQKNILINSVTDRKEPIDLTGVDKYDSFAEFEFAKKNPDKYKFLNSIGVSYDDYDALNESGKEAYTWAFKNPDGYTMSKAVSKDLIKYRKYAGELNDIHADKDKYGKSISGTRKTKVIDYLNSINLDYGAKLILFKNEYNADDTYNYEIIEYLNGRNDLTYSEKKTILEDLGFRIDGEGNISW